MVGFSKAGIDNQVYKDVAMQVAAMNPVSVDKEDVPEKILAQEMDIARDQARREGKPEEMLEKIAQGKLNKFFKESTLMNQEFIKDSKLSIRQYLESQDKGLRATGFVRYTLNV
jgi:elongation factor Ts